MKTKILMSLSGGMDSATLLAFLLGQGYEVECVSFSYGAKHNQYEGACAEQLAAFYGVKLHSIDLTGVMQGFASDLLKTGGDIPEGHYSDESMKSTVVPCRNMIFLAIIAGLAESIGAARIALGIHSGDHAIYPDCRPEFFRAMADAILRATDEKVRVVAPFLDMDKTLILKWGIPAGVPYQITRTCYKDQPEACGVCGACVERLEGFASNGVRDPAPYVEGVR